MSFQGDITSRALHYAQWHNLALADELGAGVHGIVIATESQPGKGIPTIRSAIKVHRQVLDYLRERDVYLRLKQHEITTIRGCHVPRLLASDDELGVLELTIVTRPFVLDFAGAFLDRPPDFSEEVLAEWRAEKSEQFGPRWGEVQAIMRCLEGLGIFLLDVNPGNISFGD